MQLKNIIILRDGSSLTGEVKDKKITIKTSFGLLSFDKGEIVHIHFKNPPQFLNDELLLKTSDKLKGEITNKLISFKLESSKENLKLEKDKIHTIMFLDNV